MQPAAHAGCTALRSPQCAICRCLVGPNDWAACMASIVHGSGAGPAPAYVRACRCCTAGAPFHPHTPHPVPSFPCVFQLGPTFGPRIVRDFPVVVARRLFIGGDEGPKGVRVHMAGQRGEGKCVYVNQGVNLPNLTPAAASAAAAECASFFGGKRTLTDLFPPYSNRLQLVAHPPQVCTRVCVSHGSSCIYGDEAPVHCRATPGRACGRAPCTWSTNPAPEPLTFCMHACMRTLCPHATCACLSRQAPICIVQGWMDGWASALISARLGRLWLDRSATPQGSPASHLARGNPFSPCAQHCSS